MLSNILEEPRLSRWHTVFTILYLQCCIYNTVFTILYLQCCIYNTLFTILYLQYCIYNAVFTILYLQYCIYNAVFTMLYLQCCIYNAVFTILNLSVGGFTSAPLPQGWLCLCSGQSYFSYLIKVHLCPNFVITSN